MAAVGIAAAIGLGGPPPPGPNPAPPPSPSTTIKTQQRVDKVTGNLLSVKTRWQSRGYRVTTRTEPAFDCAVHSYGQVQDFFAAHDCDALIRTYGEFRDKNRNVILVAVSWVDMPTTGAAAKLRKLVDTHGTGNVTELSRDRGLYRNVRYDGIIYHSDIVGTAVWNVQVQPVGWAPAAGLLDEIRADVLAAAVEST